MTDKTGKADLTHGTGISRRKVLGGAAVAVGVGAGLVTTTAYAKTAQKDAQYVDKAPGAQKCSACMQFEAPGSCKLVEGTIAPDGYCILFTPKA